MLLDVIHGASVSTRILGLTSISIVGVTAVWTWVILQYCWYCCCLIYKLYIPPCLVSVLLLFDLQIVYTTLFSEYLGNTVHREPGHMAGSCQSCYSTG